MNAQHATSLMIALHSLVVPVLLIANPSTDAETVATMEQVAIRVTVRGTDGKAVNDAYVAFVAPDRPMWRPSAEMIARRGAASIHVARGKYKVLAGSKGMQEALRTLQIEGPMEIAFDLVPAVPVAGTVHDTDGTAISGASVRHLRAVGPIERSTVSDLARRYFAGDWETRTDARGNWVLPGRSDGAIPLLIEAAGFAPEHRFGRSSDGNPVILRRGSTLRLTFDRVDSDLFVTLLSNSGDSASAAARGWQPIAWARAASTTAITWDSVPPGTYAIVARYFDPKRFSSPVKIGSVAMEEGELREARLSLPSHVRRAASTVALFVADQSAAELVDTRGFDWSSGTTHEVPVSVEQTSGGVVLHVKTEATPAALFVTTPDAILVPQASTPSADGESVATVRFRRADIEVTIFSAEGGAQLPQWTVAQFFGCDGHRVAIMSAVSKEGVIELPTPVVCRKVVLRLIPFEPLILELSQLPGTRRSLGPYRLRAAGSARIAVVRDPSGTPARGASVRALVADGALQDGIPVADGIADAEGKLTLNGLPVSRELILEAQEVKSEITGVARVRVEPGDTAIVDPLRIPEPSSLILAPRLLPDFVERFPSATIQSVVLDRAGDARDARARRSGKLDEDEEIHFKELRPGTWQASILVEAGGSVQPIAADPIELRAGETRRVNVDVEPLVFEGQVTKAGQRLAANVGFAEPPRANAVRRFARTDSQGRFTVMLAARGIYRVSVTPLADPDSFIDVGEVHLDDPNRSVEIRVPTASILVRVTKDEEPVEGAEVTAAIHTGTSFGTVAEVTRAGTSGSNGELLLEGLTSGRWRVEAVRPESSSRGETAVDLDWNDQRTAIVSLREAAALRGVARDVNGVPLHNAAIDCLFVGPSGLPRVVHDDTDAGGQFMLDLPTPLPRRIDCGLTTTAGQVGAYSLIPTASAELVLPRETGSLSIPDWGAAPNRDAFWLVSRDGRVFDLSWFAAKTRGTWLPLFIAHVPAGSWKIVRVTSPQDWLRLATAGGNALSAIEDFRVQARETKRIHLHASQATDP